GEALGDRGERRQLGAHPRQMLLEQARRQLGWRGLAGHGYQDGDPAAENARAAASPSAPPGIVTSVPWAIRSPSACASAAAGCGRPATSGARFSFDAPVPTPMRGSCATRRSPCSPAPAMRKRCCSLCCSITPRHSTAWTRYGPTTCGTWRRTPRVGCSRPGRGDRPPHLGAAPSRTLEGCPHGPAALGGACQAVLLPQLRADFCAAPRVRDRGDPRPRGAEVRVPELLLFADDPRGLLRGTPLRGVGGVVRRRAGVGLPVRTGTRHATRVLRSRAGRARAVVVVSGAG